jgi:HEPN domain-containing protein
MAEKASEEGDYDTAAREAEYFVQLYIKSLIYRVLGEERRGHDIRGLLGILASSLLGRD